MVLLEEEAEEEEAEELEVKVEVYSFAEREEEVVGYMLHEAVVDDELEMELPEHEEEQQADIAEFLR